MLIDLHAEMVQSVSVMSSSSQLLLMNVEDILGYAQLQAGKFVKQIRQFNVKRAIQDIISIQKYQADAKQIKISTEFLGFPTKRVALASGSISKFSEQNSFLINSDEKRLKQVLLNLQSNALKFTRDKGTVSILCELIAPTSAPRKERNRDAIRHLYRIHDIDLDNVTDHTESDSEAKEFIANHGLTQIFHSHPEFYKIVVSVKDSGIGIKRKNKLQLFKLFGCI